MGYYLMSIGTTVGVGVVVDRRFHADVRTLKTQMSRNEILGFWSAGRPRRAGNDVNLSPEWFQVCLWPKFDVKNSSVSRPKFDESQARDPPGPTSESLQNVPKISKIFSFYFLSFQKKTLSQIRSYNRFKSTQRGYKKKFNQIGPISAEIIGLEVFKKSCPPEPAIWLGLHRVP